MMRVLLCVAVLFVIPLILADSDLEQEDEIKEVVVETEVGLTAATAFQVSHVDKRGRCRSFDMQLVVACFDGIPDRIGSLKGVPPCRTRYRLLLEFQTCALKYDCQDNYYVKKAIRLSMEKYDNFLKSRDIFC